MRTKRSRKYQARSLRLEALDRRLCLANDLGITASPWCNHETPQDVNQDEIVSPIDALLVINSLNTRGAGPLAAEGESSHAAKVDVNGDSQLTAMDVLSVVNRLNGSTSVTAQEVESNPSDEPPPAADELESDPSTDNPTPADELESDPPQDNTPPADDVESNPPQEDQPPADDVESDPPQEDPAPSDDLESDPPPADETPNDETRTDESPTDEEDCEPGELRERAIERLFNRLDADDDGGITESEVSERVWDILAAADADADASITLAELTEADLLPGRHHGRDHGEGRRGDLFERFDANGDGSLSLDEVTDVLWERISAADANGDGLVTVEELADRLTSQAVEKFFEHFDENGDDLITESELPAALWERLSEADSDGTEGLSAAELEEVAAELRNRLPRIPEEIADRIREHARRINLGEILSRVRGRR